MARPLRLESEDGVYHVLNRGNYRADIFRGDKAKASFLRCLDEACAKTGWRVHAWCLMSNHYHLALSTPRANLVGAAGQGQALGFGVDRAIVPA
jgi:putative transposase